MEWSIISSACDREWFWEWGLINTNIWYDTHECLWVRLEICVKPKVSRSYLNENRFWSVKSSSTYCENGVWLLGEQSGIKWRSIPRMELISLYWSIYRRMLVRQCSWVILKSTHVHPSRQKFNIETHSGNNILGCMYVWRIISTWSNRKGNKRKPAMIQPWTLLLSIRRH